MSRKTRFLAVFLFLVLAVLLALIGFTIHRFLSEQTPAPVEPPEPVVEPAEPAEPELTEDSPQSLWPSYENKRFTFLYNPIRTEVSETEKTVSATPPGQTLPRMDLLRLEPARDLADEDFLFLAKTAVASYYAVPPDAESITAEVLFSEDGFIAVCSVPATADSDAMSAQVQLKDNLLMILLLPQNPAEEETKYWQQVWDSVEIKKK